MIRLDGKVLSQKLRLDYKNKVKSSSVKPGLAVVLIGEDPASQIYVKNKIKACEEVGIKSIKHQVSPEISAQELKSLIDQLNKDESIHGILVQFPLPKGMNVREVLSWVSPQKDVDGLGAHNISYLWGAGGSGCLPCTPSGIMNLLKYNDIDVSGQVAVVIGRSQIVGLPVFQLLQRAGATVTLCHSKTKNLKQHTLLADIVVVAAGQPQFITKDFLKKGSLVIDVGIHRDSENKICGDVCTDGLDGHVSAMTPVPGGVGPMTITMLLENTLRLAGIIF